MATHVGRNTLLQRLIGAMALDRAIYEEVEADDGATGQAFLVVLASSVAAGVGLRPLDTQTVSSVVFLSMLALLTWIGWALLTYQIGTRLMPEKATSSDVGELLRTLGFAATPGLLRALGVLPDLTVPVHVVTTLWMLAAMVIAVQQALDYRSTTRAVAVCGLALLLSVSLAVVLGLVWGPSVS